MKNKLSHILLLTILLLSVNDSYAQLAKKIHVIKAGTLVTYLTENEGNEITHLTLTGNLRHSWTFSMNTLAAHVFFYSWLDT